MFKPVFSFFVAYVTVLKDATLAVMQCLAGCIIDKGDAIWASKELSVLLFHSFKLLLVAAPCIFQHPVATKTRLSGLTKQTLPGVVQIHITKP